MHPFCVYMDKKGKYFWVYMTEENRRARGTPEGTLEEGQPQSYFQRMSLLRVLVIKSNKNLGFKNKAHIGRALLIIHSGGVRTCPFEKVLSYRCSFRLFSIKETLYFVSARLFRAKFAFFPALCSYPELTPDWTLDLMSHHIQEIYLVIWHTTDKKAAPASNTRPCWEIVTFAL